MTHRALAADLRACRTMLRHGSQSFFAASLLLPRRVRRPASALYAFCRLADDGVDQDGGRRLALAAFQQRLDRIYAGCPDPHPADRALTAVFARYGIPRALPQALLEGFAWDIQGRRYPDLSALYAYAARVAGTVGAMMAMLMEVRRADVLARACDLGVAMQLTNIARDVGEDARAGRLYLPLNWMTQQGIDPERWLARPRFDDRIATVVQRLLRAADQLYRRAGLGIARLPWDCRPGIFGAQMIYAEIGREIERRGLDSISQRAYVSRARKLRLLGRALVATAARRQPDGAPPLDETRFLVDAAATSAG